MTTIKNNPRSSQARRPKNRLDDQKTGAHFGLKDADNVEQLRGLELCHLGRRGGVAAAKDAVHARDEQRTVLGNATEKGRACVKAVCVCISRGDQWNAMVITMKDF
jgi:hypothetical protein